MPSAPNHGARDHAPWSPSGTGRWRKCAQSVLMTENAPKQERRSTPDTLFGEGCHECSEAALRNGMSASGITDMVEAREWPAGFTAREALEVILPYVGYIQTRKAELTLLYGDEAVKLYVEEKFTLLRKECYGTPDAAFVWPDGIEVIDLKGGAGYMVDAYGNPQLLTYAAMLAKKHKMTQGLLRLTIVQPRRTDGKEAVDSWDDAIGTAVAWGRECIAHIKEARANPNSAPIDGEHCHWCPAAAQCPKMHENATSALTVIEDTAPKGVVPVAIRPELLSPQTLAEIVTKAPVIVKWLKAVTAYATENPPPGFKLVEGSSDREWRSDEEVTAVLTQLNIPLKTFMVEKRIGITDTVKILKMIGRPDLADMLFVKPPGKPTLAPESDPRPAINPTDALGVIA